MKIKYPRTYHLEWSEGKGSDDKIQFDLSSFEGKEVVITEKMDGENTTMMNEYYYARSLDSNNHPSRNFAKGIWGNIKHNIPIDFRICGENLYAKHSLIYNNLPSYFMVFSIWNKEKCLSWDESKPKVMFIMLNPSTADANNDDPTIRRCVGFAKSWGFGGLYVCNLFAFRATNPKELLKAHNPFGDQNIWHTRKLSDEVDTIVCAWGNKPILKKILKNQNPYKLLDFAWLKLHYLELSKDETPKHPLYLRGDISPTQVAYVVP